MSHLAKLYLDGETVDLHQFVSKEEVKLIYDAYIKLEKTTALKPYFDYFDEKIAYDKIRLALSIIEKENRPT
jgi:ATP-dependent DNA helicase RecQ